ncbi:MAG: AarF/ABC1/UbiB kinase family protein [Rhodocyclaceae bacterium]|nr:AarF/ABC1/UbiB kinase family protein [Rhodocyclaceae bacterium]
MNKLEKPVPAGRVSRLSRLGVMATSVAGGMLAEGARRLAKGNIPSVPEMLLTPANARRITDELSRLRGAAMKVGQLLSMDAGDIIPPALAEILARLRNDAISMPMSQLVAVLEKEWGTDWSKYFSRFTFTPSAAASIGQVHRAVTVDGLSLAIKVQYPGVKESIDSDIDNVAALLRVSGLLPASIDIKSILNEAKQQLHAEADYKKEQDWLACYAGNLGTDTNFLMPRPYTQLTTQNVLAMTWVEGDPVESLVNEPASLRNRVAKELFELALKEIFEFGALQTDPNFANYRFNREAQKIVLLDFGATRNFPKHIAAGYRNLMRAALARDRKKMHDAATEIGYFTVEMSQQQVDVVMDLFEMACEPLCHVGPYDFGASTLPKRMHDAGMALAMDRDFWHTPPIDALFLHRKLAGIYLLAARLKASLDVGSLDSIQALIKTIGSK